MLAASIPNWQGEPSNKVLVGVHEAEESACAFNQITNKLEIERTKLWVPPPKKTSVARASTPF